MKKLDFHDRAVFEFIQRYDEIKKAGKNPQKVLMIDYDFMVNAYYLKYHGYNYDTVDEIYEALQQDKKRGMFSF